MHTHAPTHTRFRTSKSPHWKDQKTPTLCFGLPLCSGGSWLRLTKARGQWLVPHSAVSTQTGQSVAAMHGIPWVTTIQHHGVGKVAFIADPVAIIGDAWILTLDEIKT